MGLCTDVLPEFRGPQIRQNVSSNAFEDWRPANLDSCILLYQIITLKLVLVFLKTTLSQSEERHFFLLRGLS